MEFAYFVQYTYSIHWSSSVGGNQLKLNFFLFNLICLIQSQFNLIYMNMFYQGSFSLFVLKFNVRYKLA